VIIADRPLKELVPLTTQDGILTTQYPKDPVEELGLLKMDFLGLKTLTVISEAESHIRRKEGLEKFRVTEAPLEDEATFKLLNEARTIRSISVGIGRDAPSMPADDDLECR
jgi:DNA polymerase-3 subunit alpha